MQRDGFLRTFYWPGGWLAQTDHYTFSSPPSYPAGVAALAPAGPALPALKGGRQAADANAAQITAAGQMFHGGDEHRKPGCG